MESIFNVADRTRLMERINHLNSSSPALWGKMNVSQMLAHCQVLLRMALGEFEGKRGLMALLFGRIAKNRVLSHQPFKPNLPTLTEAKITSVKDFDTEKLGLIELIKRFESGPVVLIAQRHPFFGPLTTDEWDKLQVKHLDHHLRQFGV